MEENIPLPAAPPAEAATLDQQKTRLLETISACVLEFERISGKKVVQIVCDEGILSLETRPRS